MKLSEWFWLLILSFLWATSFFLVKLGLAELTPLGLTLLRIGFAALFLLVGAIWSGEKFPTSLSTWRDFLAMGVLNNLIPFSLVALAQTQITSGLAAILNATTPVFTVVMAHFLIKGEHLTIWRSLGILFGLLGVGILVGIDLVKGLSLQSLGQIAVLGAAFSYACAGIYGQRLRQYSALSSATGMLFSGAMVMIPIAMFGNSHFFFAQSFPTMKVQLAIIGLGFSTAMTYILYFKLLAKVGSANLMLSTFLVPVSALLLGTVFLAEKLAWNELVGMTLIFVGLLGIDGRLLISIRKNL
ncbi:MAG: DMT family transporter [Pseudanabaenaceae cyanobacterium bins.68]|nr:DMT family transporter [Pseudanabaenaceae cyanobacterium bins.68]